MIRIITRLQSVLLSKVQLQEHGSLMLKAAGYEGFDLGIALVSKKRIHELNRVYRHKDSPTDILSFPYHDTLVAGKKIKVTCDEDKNLGDIFLFPERVVEDACKHNRTLEEHVDVLLAHGIAHLLGYDHETDPQFRVMRRIENKLLRALNEKS